MVTDIPKPNASLIVRELRDRVLSGRWRREEQIATEHELAREFRVSRGTVVRSLRQLENEGLLWSRRGGGRYVAGNVQRIKTRTIGLIGMMLARLGHPTQADEMAGIRKACIAAGYNVQIFTLSEERATLADLLATIDLTRLDGAILHNATGTPTLNKIAKEMPVVWYGPLEGVPGKTSHVRSVQIDQFGATFDAANHLLDLGHRNLLLVSVSQQWEQGAQQCTGYRLAMRRARMEESRRQILSPRNLDQSWLEPFTAMLRASDRPTGIVFGSDELLLTGLQGIEAAGLKIPRDISIVNSHDALSTEPVPVPITGARADYELLGQRATEILLGMIDGPELDKAADEVEVIPSRLIIRESTAAPRGPARA